MIGERFETKGLMSRTNGAHLRVVPIPVRKYQLLQEFVTNFPTSNVIPSTLGKGV